ncbi:MAG: ATP-binding protein [Candidatus Hydrogenedentales bacterium]
MFIVADSGTLPSPPILETMFMPFYSTKKKKGGVGLGLFITKHIIDAHEGTLTLDDSSVTTRFLVRIPSKASSFSTR